MFQGEELMRKNVAVLWTLTDPKTKKKKYDKWVTGVVIDVDFKVTRTGLIEWWYTIHFEDDEVYSLPVNKLVMQDRFFVEDWDYFFS
jgi:hypothetical protein